MASFVSILLLLITFKWQPILMADVDVHVARLELLKNSYTDGIYNITHIRVTRHNISSMVLNWNADFEYEINKDVMVEYAFYSMDQHNSNQFTKSTISVPKSTVCDAFNKYGPMLLTSSMKSVTNLPVPGKGKHICPFPKVKLAVKLFFLQ